MKNLYLDNPEMMEFEANISYVNDNSVVLDRSAFYPQGGGQPSDQGMLIIDGQEYKVCKALGSSLVLDRAIHRPDGLAHCIVDQMMRQIHSRLHTALHVLNAVVFKNLDGARVTGAEIKSDGTGRMDFNLPDVENSEIRALEPLVNQVIARDLPVLIYMLPREQVLSEYGFVRTENRTVPADANGRVRVVEVQDLDRQACGGTHVKSTALCGPILLQKVENKGRTNRRVYIRLADKA